MSHALFQGIHGICHGLQQRTQFLIEQLICIPHALCCPHDIFQNDLMVHNTSLIMYPIWQDLFF